MTRVSSGRPCQGPWYRNSVTETTARFANSRRPCVSVVEMTEIKPAAAPFARQQVGRENHAPLAVGVDGAALQVQGGVEDLQARALQDELARRRVLLPVRHHRRLPQLLLQRAAWKRCSYIMGFQNMTQAWDSVRQVMEDVCEVMP